MNLVKLPARSGGAPRSKAQDGDASAVAESRKFNVDRSKREAMMEKNKKRVEEQIAADHAKHKLKPQAAAGSSFGLDQAMGGAAQAMGGAAHQATTWRS